MEPTRLKLAGFFTSGLPVDLAGKSPIQQENTHRHNRRITAFECITNDDDLPNLSIDVVVVVVVVVVVDVVVVCSQLPEGRWFLLTIFSQLDQYTRTNRRCATVLPSPLANAGMKRVISGQSCELAN